MSRNWSFLQSLIIAGTFLSTLHFFDRLPAMIPLHWNIRGEVDGYGPRHFIYGIPAVMLILQTLMGLVMKALHDDKKPVRDATGERAVANITTATLGFLALVQWMIINTALGTELDVIRVISAGACLLIMVIGRQVPGLPRNFWAGIRTPWTLASDYVWEETHRRAGLVMTRAGMAGAALSLTPWPLAGLLVAAGGALFPVYDSWRISAGGRR